MDLQIEEFDSKIREIIPEKATLEQVATGFGFTKGPIWCGDYLLFSDISRSRIVRLQRHSYGPEITTFRTPSGNSNGLTLDRSGRLIACVHIRAFILYLQGEIKEDTHQQAVDYLLGDSLMKISASYIGDTLYRAPRL